LLLSNIKQEQITRALRASRGTYLTLYRYYVYITSGATVDTRHRSRRAVFAKKVAALSLPLRHSAWRAAEHAAPYIILLHGETQSRWILWYQIMWYRNSPFAVHATRECAETPRWSFVAQQTRFIRRDQSERRMEIL